MMSAFRSLAICLLLLPVAGCEVDEGWIEIRNNTGRAIVSVTIDPCGASTPGSNRLGTGSIPDGEEEAFRVDFGCYEVNVLTADGLPGFWEVGIGSDDRRVILFAEPPGV
jgi:hypothetical protein